MSFPYAFNHGQLEKFTNGPGVRTVVFSLVNLHNPLMQKSVMHIAAHFADVHGDPLNASDFEIACPYPPGWNTGHDPHHPDNVNGYHVVHSELSACAKFIIPRDELLQAFAHHVVRNDIKQLLCALESPNAGTDTEPMETQLRFIAGLEQLPNRRVGQVARSFSPSFEPIP